MAVKRKVRRPPASKRGRAHGDASRERILEAAREIASVRGYDGTGIAGVSERSGLPASSIYWHFANKDELLAAVIERSFNRWLEAMEARAPARAGATREERFIEGLRHSARALTEAPDFLRLGLMLSLERRPAEASARQIFLKVREQTLKQMVGTWEAFFEGELDAAGVRKLATLAMAAADGLFIAREVSGDGRAFESSFALLGAALLGAAEHLKSPSG
ncbi:MAG: helix-turn-helix domain-containing protein, partial [Myxococcota bacterium]